MDVVLGLDAAGRDQRVKGVVMQLGNGALSTAEAQSWTELPELASIRIGRRQPSPPRVGWRPPPAWAPESRRRSAR